MQQLIVNSIAVTTVTPEQAAEFLTWNYRKNRPLREWQVKLLTAEMNAGRFMETAEIHIVYNRGEPSLVNGQHSCAAIIAHGQPIRVTLRKSTTREDGQLAMVYALGHDTGLRRTFTDAMGAYGVVDQTGLDRRNADSLAAAIRFIRQGFMPGGANARRIVGSLSAVDIVDDCINWSPVMRHFISITEGIDGMIYRSIKKQGVLSIALISLHYQRDKATEFWHGVVMPDGIGYYNPIALCRRYIEVSKKTSGLNHGVSSSRLARQVAACWNSYMVGDDRKFVRVLDEYAPFPIEGTPYTGKHAIGFLSKLPAGAFRSESTA